MELIERYLHEVGRHLPRSTRADVQAELRSLIQDQLDARSGGAPSEDTIVSVLKEFGPPREVAAGYSPAYQYLIGPTLYPTFLTIIQIGVVILIFVQALGLAVGIARGGAAPGDALASWGRLWESLVGFLGAAVIIFAILERLEVQPQRAPQAWDPRTLPRVARDDAVNKVETALELTFTLIALALLNMVRDRLGLIGTGGSETGVILPAILRPYVLAGAALMVLDVALHLVLLYRGRWQLATRLGKIALNLLWLALLAQVAGLDWETLLVELSGLESLRPVAFSVRFSMLILAFIILVDAARHAYQLVRAGLGASLDGSDGAGAVKAGSPG